MGSHEGVQRDSSAGVVGRHVGDDEQGHTTSITKTTASHQFVLASSYELGNDLP